MLRPEVRPAILSCAALSALRAASFTAAAIRSSTTSLSSCNRAGSTCTRRTSWRQVMVMLTSPPPDDPVTSMLASSSCALRRFSCMACACLRILPNPPFIPPSRLRLGPYGARVDPGVEALLQGAHVRIVLDRVHRRLLALVLGARFFLGRRRLRRFPDDDFQTDGATVILFERPPQRLLPLLAVQSRARGVERERHGAVRDGFGHGVARQLAQQPRELELRHHLAPVAAVDSRRRRGAGRLRRRRFGGGAIGCFR